MGSLGWANYYWCRRREYNVYIPDYAERPLCYGRLDRWYDGLRPPRQPDARERAARGLQPALPPNAANIVAQFLHHEWEP